MVLDPIDEDFSQTGLDPTRISYVYFPNVKEIAANETRARLGILSAVRAQEAWEILQEVMRGRGR